MRYRQRQQGFTLVEIAVVLVIIGLLLGGVLKGQELIASARVRNLADQQAGIQAAYFGFIDRYRAVPGDMSAADASNAIGTTITSGGNGDGRLSDPTSSPDWAELNGLWEQLAAAGFIKGSYDGDSSGPPGGIDTAPVNVFNGVLVMGRHGEYAPGTTTAQESARLVLTMGQNVPVDIARELDVKLDDGQPETGSLRNAAEGSNVWNAGSTTSCVNSTPDPSIWNITADGQNCNPAYIF